MGPRVQQPDNTNIQATESSTLPLSVDLLGNAQKACILPNLKSASLIALGQLCDDDCKIVLSKEHLDVIKNNKVILQGQRNWHDDLWDIPIIKTTLTRDNYHFPPVHPGIYTEQTKPKHNDNLHKSREKCLSKNRSAVNRYARQINNIKTINEISKQECAHLIDIQLRQDEKKLPLATSDRLLKRHKMAIIIKKKQTHHNLVRYLHAACFAPVPSTWKKAISNNNFITWPGLTVNLVNKNLPLSMATLRGHIHREQKNLQSTRKKLQERKTKPEVKNEQADTVTIKKTTQIMWKMTKRTIFQPHHHWTRKQIKWHT